MTNLWDEVLPPGEVIEIREPVHVPAGRSVRGVPGTRSTTLKSFVPAGEFALNLRGITARTGGGVSDVSIVVATPGSGGISAYECVGLDLRNLLVVSNRNPLRDVSTGILLDGGKSGSSHCRIDHVDLMLCQLGLVLDTSARKETWSNRHTITALWCYGCGLGMLARAGSTNRIWASFETCGRGYACTRRSTLNRFDVVEENCAESSLLGPWAQGNLLDGVWARAVREAYEEK